jgi:transcriptional regulator with XRE-family HTH domain
VITALAEVGANVRKFRTHRNKTLTNLAAATGISKSTLSRLESGQRKPSLELLLPIAEALRVPLDELVAAPEVGDPRIRLRPHSRRGRVVVPLARRPDGGHAWKLVIPPEHSAPELRRHDGFEWLYILSGRLRLRLGDEEMVLDSGEVAEFDARTPHWFGAAGSQPVELLSLLGTHHQHVRARAGPTGGAKSE